MISQYDCQNAFNRNRSVVNLRSLRALPQVLMIAFGLATSLLLNGCAGDLNSQRAATSNRSLDAAIPAEASDCGGHWIGEGKDGLPYRIYGFEGKIVTMHVVDKTLTSLFVRGTRSLDNAGGYQPLSAGSKAHIHFDECLNHFAKLKLTDGDTVLIYFGQIDDGKPDNGKDEINWGSNSHLIAVKRSNGFVDYLGKNVDKDHPFDIHSPN